MRINKSFIVKRSLSGPKQQLAASKQLANFMREAIVENQGPLWIAQRKVGQRMGMTERKPLF